MAPPIIKTIRAIDDRLIFELDQGREVSLPLSVSTRLSKASQAQRDRWTIGPRGISAHWPDVDEDIAIWEILGIREEVYFQSLKEAPVG